jgi:hypothetical protein
MWYVYPREYYLALKKSEIMSLEGKWMELGVIMLSKISQMIKRKGKGLGAGNGRSGRARQDSREDEYYQNTACTNIDLTH